MVNAVEGLLKVNSDNYSTLYTVHMYASLVCVQFMYSTSLGLARQLSYEEEKNRASEDMDRPFLLV